MLLRSERSIAIGNNTLTIRTFLFSPPLRAHQPACTANICVFFFYRPTGRPRRTSLPQACHRNATNRTRSVSSARHSTSLCHGRAKSDLRRPSGGVTHQPQCRGLWHSSRPRARSFTRSPSSAPPSFTQSPFSLRSLVRDGQTSPHRPRLVVSRSTCPPLSPSPHANSFVIGTAVINTHTPDSDYAA